MPTIVLNDIVRLDLSLAVAFLAIFQEGSVSRAAQRLSLSQSALSGSLARLRAITQDPLFIRRNGGMEPTPRAIAMAGDLEQGVGLIAQALRPQPAFDPATSSARFAIGMSDDFELAMGPAIMRRVMAEAPASPSPSARPTATLSSRLSQPERSTSRWWPIPARSWLAAQELGRSAYACLHDPQVIEGR
jgi:DNA-binding transcriptional LysR family regulator